MLDMNTIAHLRRPENAVINGIKVNEIIDVFENLGYECQIGSEIVGMSGATHTFDIIAKKQSEIIVIDIVSFRSSILDTPISDDEAFQQISIASIRMRVKGMDCGAYHSIIIHLSSYFDARNDSGISQYDPLERFLKEFEIKMIRSADVRGAAEKLRMLLSVKEAV